MVDDGDVAGLQPLGEVLGASIDPHAAAHAGHPIAVIARAAGVTAASAHYRLATTTASPSGVKETSLIQLPKSVSVPERETRSPSTS